MIDVVSAVNRQAMWRFTRWTSRRVIAACALVSAPALALSAQERLVGRQSAGFGLSFEAINFSGSGLTQGNYGGFETSRITSVRQHTLPVTTGLAFGTTRFDLTALYSSSTVNYHDDANASDERSATLEGISDLRVRATSARSNSLIERRRSPSSSACTPRPYAESASRDVV